MVSTDVTNNPRSLDTQGRKKQSIWKGRNQNYQSFEYNSDDISYLSLRLSNKEEKNSGLSQNPYFASLQRSSDYPLDHIQGLAIVDKNHKRYFLLSWKEVSSSSQVFLKEIDAFSEMLGIPLVILDSNYNDPENKIASWKIPLTKWEASRTWGELFIMVFAMGFAVILLYAIALYPLLFVVAILPKWILSLALQRPFPREGRIYFQEAVDSDNRREVLLPENRIDMRGVDPLTVRRIQEVLNKKIFP